MVFLRTSWAPVLLRVAGLVLLYWLASEPTPSRTSTVRLISRPMTAAGLASIADVAGTPDGESYGDPDGEGEVPPEDDFVPVSPPAPVEPGDVQDRLPAGCVEAAVHLLSPGLVSSRPWLALPSRCHTGGDWHSQCGPGLAHTHVQGRRGCVPPTCASCGVDEAPPDPEAEVEAAGLPLSALGPVSAASAALAAAAASARANDRNCCHPGGSWRGRCGTEAALASGAAEYSWKEGYRVCHDLPLTPPPPERAHAGRPFVQLHALAGTVAGDHGLASATGGRRRPRAGHSGAGAGDSARAGGGASGGSAAGGGGGGAGGGGLMAYLITLEARPRSDGLPAPIHDKLRLLSAALGGAPAHAIPAVPAASALAAVEVHSSAAAARLFGKQASEPEFEAALGCALSHLRAARRAVRDGAAPALILEEDASLELSHAWPVGPVELAARAPGGWTAIQVGGPRHRRVLPVPRAHARGLRLGLARPRALAPPPPPSPSHRRVLIVGLRSLSRHITTPLSRPTPPDSQPSTSLTPSAAERAGASRPLGRTPCGVGSPAQPAQPSSRAKRRRRTQR